jgi:hypothetical protein
MNIRGITFLVCLWGVFGAAVHAGAMEWEYYALTKEGNSLFFDKNSVSISDNVVKVNQKEMYTPENLFWRNQRLGTRYLESKETVNQIEINCSNIEYRVTMVTEYDSDGKVIEMVSHEKRSSWKPAVDSPDIFILYDLVCFPEWKYVISSENSDYFVNKGALRVNNSNVNITFWMKEVDKKTGKETEKEKVTMVCEKDKYTLRHLMRYSPDGSVKEVLADDHLRKWIPITPKSIIDGFQTLLCDGKYVRQNVKEYVQSVSR